MSLRPGEIVGGCYTVHAELAQSETGTVYEARDMMVDRLVALKLGQPGAASLVVECRRMAAVRDACAAQVYALGSHQGQELAVCERITGKLLRDVASETTELYLTRLRTLIAAVASTHDAGISIGDLAGATVLADGARLVLGRLSMSQVAPGPCFAPEVVRGDVDANDPEAAEMIDVYGIGCVAIEMARGERPFADDDQEVEADGHRSYPPPRLADLRTDLPTELSDLVEWILAKRPEQRPRSARDVLAQLDAVIDRLGTGRTRSTRVLIVDDDTHRARWLWSLARRAHPAAIVETASEGTDAAHKLNRDHPDLVFVDASLRGVMNALELCMYARGLERAQHHVHLIVIGELAERDRALFADAAAEFVGEDAALANTMLDRVRTAATDQPRRRKPPTMITG